jgi:hypothetical protein
MSECARARERKKKQQCAVFCLRKVGTGVLCSARWVRRAARALRTRLDGVICGARRARARAHQRGAGGVRDSTR